MTLLIMGLTIWCCLHFIPSLAVTFRTQLLNEWGEKNYKILFSVLMLGALVLIVLGWRATPPVHVYTPPVKPGPVPGLLVLCAFILFAAAQAKTNIKRFIRHPQLTGLIVWSIAHLLTNGDNKGLILFGTLGIWALLEIFLINKREGDWIKPEAVAPRSELAMIIVGIALYVIFLFMHPFLFGVSPFAR